MLQLYENIRKRRIELGMSQQELARRVGYNSRSTIAKIETGVIDIVQSKILKFAKVLHTTPAYLMGWEDEDPEDTEVIMDFMEKFSKLSKNGKGKVIDYTTLVYNFEKSK